MPVFPIVGAFHRPPARAILQVLPINCPLTLRPEPTNEYDPNAIQILVSTSHIPTTQHEQLEVLAAGYGFTLEEILAEPEWHLGYIPRDRNEGLTELGELEGKLGFDLKGKPTVEFEKGGL